MTGAAGHNESPEYLAFKARCEGTNINPQTLLATDYLNHFNEITMLIEMIPDMPDILEDAREWRPKSYQDHFRDSAFSDRDLAVAAYEHVPPLFKSKFEKTVRQMDSVVQTGLLQIEDTIALDEPELLRIRVSSIVQLLHQLGGVAGGIIHGSVTTLGQGEIDAVMGGDGDQEPPPPAAAEDPEDGLQARLESLLSLAQGDVPPDASDRGSVQGAIDALSDTAPPPSPEPVGQDAIDALFDSPPSEAPPARRAFASETDALHGNELGSEPLAPEELEALLRDTDRKDG